MDNWEMWFRRYRGSELARLVVRLSEVLLARGCCTADDARGEPLDGDPRIRGGAMRALVALGLATKSEAVLSTSDVCHHRPIQKFVMRDPVAARMLVQRHAESVLALSPPECRYAADQNGQLMMAV